MTWWTVGSRRWGIRAGGLLLTLNCCTDPAETVSKSEAPIPAEGDESAGRDRAGPRFRDVGAAAGLDAANVSGTAAQRYMSESASAGAAFLDYDGDGFLDLLLVNGTRPDTVAVSLLYHNVPGKPAPERVFAASDVDLGPGGWGMGCAVGDVDNDGDPDIYATYLGPNRLYLNEEGRRFSEVAGDYGVADAGWSASAAFGDLDADGYLDLYVANYVEFDVANPEDYRVDCPYKGLPVFCGPGGFNRQPDKVYRNRGDGFEDLSTATGIADHALPGLGVVLVDLDTDGDLDIYVANDTAPNLLFRNDGDWRFEEVGLPAGVAFSGQGKDQAGMGVHTGDYDNDGRPDLFVTNFADDVNTLYQNESGGGNLQFVDVTYLAGLGGPVVLYLGWGTGFFDYDNDGWLDLYVVNGHLYPQLDRYAHGLPYAQKNLLYRNQGGHFGEVQERAGTGWNVEKVSRSAAVGDYDNDGDPDLLITNLNDVPTLLRNDGGNENNWLGIELVGTESNRDAIGARVQVSAGELQLFREVHSGHGFQAAHDRRLLIGLGEVDAVERVQISWPSGMTQVLERPPLRQYLTVREGEGEAVVAAPAVATTTADADGTEQGYGVRDREDGPPLPDGVEEWRTQDYVSKSSRLFNEGRYAEVKGLLEVGLRKEPDSLHLRFLLGQVLVMGLGHYEKATVELERAVADYPTAVDAHFYLARAYLRMNRLADAIRSYRRASELVPTSWEYLHELGQAYTLADSLEAAATVLLQSARQAPWEPSPHLQLAKVYRAIEREEEALEHQASFALLTPDQEEAKKLEKRSKEHPRDPRVRNDLATVYRRQGRLNEALSQFRKAVKLDPRNAPGFAGIGSALHDLGRFDEAVRAFAEASRHAPDLAAPYLGLGRALAARGRIAEAIEAWEQSLQRDPDQPEARQLVDEARTKLQ